MRFQSRQLTVQAWQYGGALDGAPDWVDLSLISAGATGDDISVATPDGAMAAKKGDWLVHDGYALFVIEPRYFREHFQKA